MAAPIYVSVQRSLWFCNTVLSAVLVGRLFFSRLVVTYRYFFAAIVAGIIRTSILWGMDFSSQAYLNFWRATEPITWLINTLVVLELCSLIFKEYRGIQVLGRRTIY